MLKRSIPNLQQDELSEKQNELSALLDSIDKLKNQLQSSIDFIDSNKSSSSSLQSYNANVESLNTNQALTYNTEAYVREIKKIIKARHRRFSFFDADMFADPAWDILLDLYVASLEHRQVSVSSACIASCVPSTTALRWLNILEKNDLIVRKRDQHDLRRVFVELSQEGKKRLDNYFSSVRSNEDGQSISD
ncbi:transcriptional regulator, SarA/Rot family [Alterisphingorhabdus coralli]|uniref:MarR family transcriptional regulator n=1 Tax=Alterisphingorhabdus coralli TaxID=3071408 RepID=A0AA97F583_9SPHN|nr:MarR family transcriptional regulator [Parasphingorhabdus sp. SCSIO 66989]WOE74564.1 MarR family transcriptional regulator [Parasphingorhabdus sp. SCSIO 66989]